MSSGHCLLFIITLQHTSIAHQNLCLRFAQAMCPTVTGRRVSFCKSKPLVGIKLAHAICCVTENDNQGTKIEVAEEWLKSRQQGHKYGVPRQMCNAPHKHGDTLRVDKTQLPLSSQPRLH
jgi:hypothetical protein